MISVALVGVDKEEIQYIHNALRELAAQMTDERWQFETYLSAEKFAGRLSDHSRIDIGCVDFCSREMRDALYQFRESYRHAKILLIADTSISPTAYLKPGIRADSLLLRPLTDDKVASVLQELLESYLSMMDEDNLCIINDGEETWRIPYNHIFYFEARERRVFARTLHDEYGFHATLERIEDTLPKEFARSHRSYIVNTSKLTNVYLSQNSIKLAGGFIVPLSRKHKLFFKDLRKKIRGMEE